MLQHGLARQTARPRQGSRWALGLLAACAAFVGVSQLPAADEKPRTDLYGDPLPQGARARLGTVRWRHATPVTYTAFAAGGKALLTVSQDTLIRLWDMSSGKEIRRFGKKAAADPNPGNDPQAQLQQQLMRLRQGYGATGVVVSADGKTLAVATAPDTVQLWEVATGKELRKFKVQANSAGALVISGDGKILAGRGPDQTVRVWDTTTGNELRQIKKKAMNQGGGRIFIGGVYGVASLAMSRDGKLLAIPETTFDNRKINNTLTLWDAGTAKELRQIELAAQTGVSALAFSPDAKILAYASGNAIHLCATDTGKEIRQVEALPGVATTLVFSPDGKTLAAKNPQDGVVRLCATETGKVVRELGEPKAAGRGGIVVGFGGFGGGSNRDVAFSPDGKLIAVGGGSVVRVWNAENGKEVVQAGGHRDAVNAVALTPDGKLVASMGADNTVRLWEAATGKQRQQFRVPANTTCVAFTADAKTVAFGGVDSTVRLREVATGKELHALQGHKNAVAAVAFSPDGKTVASRGSSDNTIRLYDAASGKELRTIALPAQTMPGNPGGAILVNVGGFGGRVGLAFSPDGKTLASPLGGGFNGAWNPRGGPATQGTMNLWDVTTGKAVHKIMLPAGYSVQSFAFSPDGRVLATEGMDQTVILWEIASGKERARFGKAEQPKQAAGMAVMVGAPFGAFGNAGMAPSSTLAFAPDGRTLAVRGLGQSVQVWDVAAGKEVGQFKGHDGAVNALVFTHDGKALASGSGDTTVLLWDVTRARAAAPTRTAKLQNAEVEALWADLIGADAPKAFHGIQKLATAPGQVVPFLGERLRPAVPADAAKIRQWVADLDSKQFSVRQRATNELEKLGELAVPPLNAVLAAKPSLETSKRVEQLLEKLTGRVLSEEQLRLVRALEVLEEIGTPEARRVLETLSRGAPGALPTREAQATLERLARRSAAR